MLEMKLVFRDLDLSRHEDIRCAVRESLGTAVGRDVGALVDEWLSDAKFRALHAAAVESRAFNNEEEVRSDFIKKIEEELFYEHLQRLYIAAATVKQRPTPDGSEVYVFGFFFVVLVVVIALSVREHSVVRGGCLLDKEFAFMA